MALEAGSAVAGVGQAIADASPTHRQCFIEIHNRCTNYTLSYPRSYIYSGNCSVPLPPSIPPSTFGSALFTKTPHTACGSVGVFTYDLLQNDTERRVKKMAVMFSVPYDFNWYSNWYAVGIFDQSKNCDENLYNQMYYETSESFIRGGASGPLLIYNGGQIKILATMSDSYQPVMKVEVSETD